MAALCVRCKKNQAVLFVSRMENGEMKSEGYCLKCAKELGMKPIDDVLNNLGLREEDLDAICEQANELLGGELMNVDQDNSNIGETGTENILRRLYGNLFPHALQRSDRAEADLHAPQLLQREERGDVLERGAVRGGEALQRVEGLDPLELAQALAPDAQLPQPFEGAQVRQGRQRSGLERRLLVRVVIDKHA